MSKLAGLHDNHRDRVRKDFLKRGLDDAPAYRALEFLLFYSIPRRDTNELAHQLLNHFGSFSAVLDAPYEELCKVKGISENSAVLLKMIPALCRLYLEDKQAPGQQLTSVEAFGAFLKPKFIGKINEVVYLLCLDNRGRLLCCEQVDEGTVNSVPMMVRRIVEVCIRFSAVAVVMAHNHPNGFALPSQEDIIATREIQKVLKTMDITLLDHIVVANDDFVSMVDSHYLQR